MVLQSWHDIKNTFLTAQAHFSLIYRVLIHDVGRDDVYKRFTRNYLKILNFDTEIMGF